MTKNNKISITNLVLIRIKEGKLLGAVYLYSLKSKLNSVEFTHDVTF